jgi:RNAse (barnase) inhibitor barstar
MKPMESLLSLLPNSKRAGVYRSKIASDEIVAAAQAAGLRAYKIDLAKARGKLGLFDGLSKALKFPAHFGKNWDALNDCLTDLAWLDDTGWVLILVNGKSFAAKYQADFDMALELFYGVAACWQEDGKPFWVIVRDQPGWTAELPAIRLS